MRAKEKPIVCDRSPNLTHTNGGLDGVHNAHRYSNTISFFGIFGQCFTCFLWQKAHKSHILRRLLSLVSHIACIAGGGIVGNLLFTRYGTAMFLPLVAFGVFALSQWLLLRLEVGGGK